MQSDEATLALGYNTTFPLLTSEFPFYRPTHHIFLPTILVLGGFISPLSKPNRRQLIRVALT